MFCKNKMQDKSPNILRVVAQPLSISKESAHEQSAKPQVAVFITHGMGQQVPFETLDAAAKGLIQAAARKGHKVTEIRARTVQVDGVKTQRAEFDMRDAEGRDVEVHVYEGYWAPITEGQVSLRDVMSFLLLAGLKGLRNSGWLSCRHIFKRWIFGRAVSFGRQLGASHSLLLTLSVLLSLVVINFITAAAGGDKFLHSSGSQVFSESIFDALTSVAGFYVAACWLLVAVFWLLMRARRYVKNPRNSHGWCIATSIGNAILCLWVASTLAAAIVMFEIVVEYPMPDWLIFNNIGALWWLVWGGLLLSSWIIKNLLVQYMGDVAAYVDSYSLDRFDDIRTRIKARVFERAQAVYSNKQYIRIAMVGHSLGSVISYDTLNALINHDALHGKQLDVTGRTKLLLTFGSPLDKTAFIFASQIDKATATREALAATLQPLIQTYIPFRDINWINVYSPRDIIGGKLDFYDDQEAKDYNDERRVKNVIDEDAMIPLAAHIEYWNNTTVFDELYANL